MGHNSSKIHTFFGRGNPQEQVSLGRENYTQEHALSLGGGGVTLFRGAVVLVIPKILIPSTANSKFFLPFCSLRNNVTGGFKCSRVARYLIYKKIQKQKKS